MPLARPTISELIERNELELASRLGLGTLIPRGPLAALARLSAGASHELHGHIDWAVRQLFPDTAEAEFLARWALIWGVARKPAVKSTGQVAFSGTDGSIIPIGAQVQRADGQKYSVTIAVTVLGGTAIASVIAVLAGFAGNTPGATPMTLVSPISGVNTAAFVTAAGLNGGSDQETDEQLRARLLQRIATPLAGGTAGDYVRWALEVPGVTRAWALPGNQGAGTVGVTFVMDGDPVTIIPNATKVAEVQAYLDARRPVTASVLVFAPVLVVVNFTIHVVPDTTQVRASVLASLQELFLREGGPNLTIPLSHVREAISLAPGETDHTLTAPTSDLVLTGGQIPTVGTITWN